MADKPDSPAVDELQAILNEDDDLAATVSEAIEASTEQEGGAAAAPEAASLPAEEGAPGRRRDDQGRFVAGDQREGADPAGEDDSKPDLEPLANWPLEVQETFRKQPREVQQYMLDRHKEMERGFHEKAQEIAPIRQAFDRWRPYCEKVGATPEQAYDRLMQTEYVLRTGTPQQKLAVLQDIARTYQIDLRPIVAQLTGGALPQGEEADPIAMHPIIQQLSQGLQGIHGFLSQQSQTQQRQVLTTSQQAVAAFRDERDASGQAAHPHFDEVVDDMLAMAHADRAMGKNPVLGELYERAVWANPTVRAKVLAAEQHKAQRAEQERKRKEAERARKAAVSITGAPSSPTDQPKTLEETVAEAMRASG